LSNQKKPQEGGLIRTAHEDWKVPSDAKTKIEIENYHGLILARVMLILDLKRVEASGASGSGLH
jgi:hypothetical protein